MQEHDIWIMRFKNLLRVAGITHPYDISAALHLAAHTLKYRLSPQNAVFYAAWTISDFPDLHLNALATFLFENAISSIKEK